jgi:hypothetical protein
MRISLNISGRTRIEGSEVIEGYRVQSDGDY